MSALREAPMWHVRYKPLPGELLSSWLVRLAHGHGLKAQTFTQMQFGHERQIWNRDIDRLGPTWLLEALSQKTCTPIDTAKRTVVAHFEGFLFPAFNAAPHISWIQSIRVYHRKRLGYGQQYCPLCLKTDAIPYYRTAWRSALLTVCPVHRCMLLDRCTKCDAPVAFHRADTGRLNTELPNISECSQCCADLGKERPILSPVHDEAAFAWLQRISSALCAYAEGVPTDVPADEVIVARQLTYLLLSNSPTNQLNDHVSRQMGMPLQRPMGFRPTVETLSQEDRYVLLTKVGWLMSDLGPKFLQAWRARAIRYNHLERGFSNAPSWYSALVNEIPRSYRGAARAVEFLI